MPRVRRWVGAKAARRVDWSADWMVLEMAGSTDDLSAEPKETSRALQLADWRAAKLAFEWVGWTDGSMVVR